MDDNVEYLIQVLNYVIHILDNSNMDNQSAFMDTVVLRLEYLQRFVVNLDIDDGVTEIIRTAYRLVTDKRGNGSEYYQIYRPSGEKWKERETFI